MDPVMEQQIKDMVEALGGTPLATRITYALFREGVRTLEELDSWTEGDFRGIRMMGDACVAAVRNARSEVFGGRV